MYALIVFIPVIQNTAVLGSGKLRTVNGCLNNQGIRDLRQRGDLDNKTSSDVPARLSLKAAS